MTSTIVLVHGAFADPRAGIASSTRCSTLAPRDRRRQPAARARRATPQSVTDLVRTIDGPVVLVGHSYGGAVISERRPRRRRDRRARLRRRLRARRPASSCFALAAMFPGSTLGDDAASRCRARDGTTDSTIAPDSFHDVIRRGRPGDARPRAWRSTQRPVTREALARTLRRPTAVEAAAVVVRVRRARSQHSLRRAPPTWPSALAPAVRSRSPEPRTPSTVAHPAAGATCRSLMGRVRAAIMRRAHGHHPPATAGVAGPSE